jgi:hypothetical protein
MVSVPNLHICMSELESEVGEMGQAKENPYISHKLNILHYIFACMLEIQFLNIWQHPNWFNADYCVILSSTFTNGVYTELV